MRRVLFLSVILAGSVLTNAVFGQMSPKDTLILDLNQSKNLEERAKILDDAAKQYNAKGDYEAVMMLTLYALDLYEHLGDTLQIAAHHNVIGTIYFSQMNLEKALEYFEKARTIFESAGDELRVAQSNGNISQIYRDMEEYDKSIYYMQQMLTTAKEYSDTMSISRAHNNLGSTYNSMTNYSLAKLHLDTAIQIKKEINDAVGLASCYLNMGASMTGLNQNQEALWYFEAALKIATELDFQQKKMTAHESLAEVHARMNHYELAYEHSLKFRSIRDSLISEQSSQNINMLVEKYESDKKDQENILLANENALLESNNQNKNLWITTGFTGIAFLASVFLIFVVRNNGIKKRKQIEFEKTKLEFEQKALRAQMNPHFIFNAINSIQSYILKKSEQEAYDYLAKFSRLIRIVLNNSQEKNLMLHQELEMIKLYVEMEQLRFNDQFEFNLRMNDDVHEYEMIVPAMLIQPYIENAIWHGLMNRDRERKGVLNLNLSMNDTLLKIVVEDNGIGREKSKQFKKEDSHKSVGMQLTEQRLLMINKMEQLPHSGAFGENAKVIVTDLKDEKGVACGTRVEIFIPVNV